MKQGDLVRVRHAGDQPLWTRKLVGKVGVVLRNERVGYNRILEIMVEGMVHRMHSLDLEHV